MDYDQNVDSTIILLLKYFILWKDTNKVGDSTHYAIEFCMEFNGGTSNMNITSCASSENLISKIFCK